MASVDGLFGGMFSNMFGGGLMDLLIKMTLGVVGLIAVGAFFWWWYNNKKKWFLKVEVKIPRGIKYLNSDDVIKEDQIQGIINAEWAKGTYNAKEGVVYIKRFKKKPIAMKPFDIKRYLQGSDILTVAQVGIEDYRPVLTESFLNMEDEKTGEKAALIRAKIDTSESKSWRAGFERATKDAYSIHGLLEKYAPYIGIGIILFMNFVGFSILYTRIK
jgi:hypothetical protein